MPCRISAQDQGALQDILVGRLVIVRHGALGPMLEEDGKEFSERWGYLSRAGLNDKSCLTRQIEKYADIYTSRVSNFLQYTCARRTPRLTPPGLA